MHLLTENLLLADTDAAPPQHGNAARARVVRSGSALVGLAVGGGLGAAAAIAARELLHVRPSSMQLALGSGATVLASISAYLFVRHARRSAGLGDIVISVALTLLALTNLIGAMLTGIAQTPGAMPLQVITSAGAGAVIAAGIAFAALAPTSHVRHASRVSERLLITGFVLVLATVALVALGVGLDPRGRAVLVMESLGAAVWASAAVGFVRRLPPTGRMGMAWMAAGAALAALACLSDAAVIAFGPRGTPTGAFIDIMAVAAFLAGALRDVETDHQTRAQSAIIDERRRLARDLHDGLAQELAYITAETRRLVSGADAEQLVEAAERALEESRAAILSLSRPTDEPLERIISDTAHSVAARAGIDVTVAVRPGLDASPEKRQALVRILREAMANAVRHGGAEHVRISLDGPAPLVLAVADDGEGFDTSGRRRPDSLGLLSIRERTENLGGRVTVESTLGSGTTVAVVLP